MSNHTSSSSHNDKTEPLTKEEWQTRLESFEFKQADMNKLIMNYLVTGKFASSMWLYCILIASRCRRFQRGGREIPS